MIPADHPWRRLSALVDWDLRFARLPHDVWGVTDHDARTITLDIDLNQAERRSTIAHELEHVARGPVTPLQEAREEARVEQAAARRLIGLEQLLDALRWSRSIEELADELWVDVALARTRLQHLHPSEHHWLARQLGHTQIEDGSRDEHLTA